MQFFKNYRKTGYTFGDDFENTGGSQRQVEFIRDLTQYVDVVDQVREGINFYEPYNIIEGERPDQVSQFLYETPVYHWTFFMMNDLLRSHGWPLTYPQMDEKIATDFPHQYIYVRADLSNIFLQNEYVTGVISGTRGKIIKRDLDHGIIVVDTFAYKNAGRSNTFRQGEAITCTGQSANTATLTIVGTGNEYNATHHYEDGDGNPIDIDPRNAPPAIYNEVTISDRYHRINNSLKQIKVIKPANIIQIASAFKRALTS